MNKCFPPNIINPLKNIYNGKTILITGGGTGLGKSMGETYLKLGGNVVISSRKEEVLEKAKTEIMENNINLQNCGTIDYIKMDLRDHNSVLNLVNRMADENRIPDIVINNAAANFLCPSEKLSYNGWNTIMDIVLKGTVDLTLEMGKKMIEMNKSGTFLSISTTYAETGSGFVLPSSIAKAGINNMTKSLSAEWGKYGIRLLGVAPGPIYTKGAFDRLDPTGNFQNKTYMKLPAGRMGEKEELANLVSYLTSEQCSWLTGDIINFDGGEVVRNAGEFNSLIDLSKHEINEMLENSREKIGNKTHFSKL